MYYNVIKYRASGRLWSFNSCTDFLHLELEWSNSQQRQTKKVSFFLLKLRNFSHFVHYVKRRGSNYVAQAHRKLVNMFHFLWWMERNLDKKKLPLEMSFIHFFLLWSSIGHFSNERVRYYTVPHVDEQLGRILSNGVANYQGKIGR